MGSRLELHQELCVLLESNRVYFNSPESVKMEYPAIRYTLVPGDTRYANNRHYSDINCYEITVIDEDPDSTIHNRIPQHFQMSRWDARYVADNLIHNKYRIYY